MSLKCNRQVKVENVSPKPTAGELYMQCSFSPPSTSFIRHSQLMSIDRRDNSIHCAGFVFQLPPGKKEKKKE